MQEILSEIAKAPREPNFPFPGERPTITLPQSASTQSLLKDAEAYAKKSQYFQAWALLDTALQAGATDAALLSRALEYASMIHRHQPVKAYLETLRKQDALTSDNLIHAAIVIAEHLEFEPAEQLLQAAFEHAEHASWHIAYGFFHEKRQQYNWAKTAYKLALRHGDNPLQAQVGLARIALFQKDFASARNTLEALTERSSTEALFIEGLLAYTADEDLTHAEKALARAVQQSPHALQAWLWLGHVRLQAKHYTTAEYAYRHAWMLLPDTFDTCYHLGKVYFEMDQLHVAIPLLEVATAQAPHLEIIASALAKAYDKAGRTQEAARVREQLGVSQDASEPTAPAVESAVKPTPEPAPTLSKPPSSPPVEPAPQASSRVNINEFQNLSENLTEDASKVHREHLALSAEQMPGPNYRQYLRTMHQWMRPKRYMEIGIETGETLAFCEPGTQGFGIDPDPRLRVELPETTRVFPVTSDAFFEHEDVQKVLGGSLDFVFIDGLHVFSQVLRDFINVEKYSTKKTVVLFHDCYPIDEITQRSKRETFFWTGDPWKIVPCLKACRPDLEVLTIKTQPSGLAMVLGCDPSNTSLDDNYDEIVKKFDNLHYNDIEANKDEALNAVANDWGHVRSRILAHWA